MPDSFRERNLHQPTEGKFSAARGIISEIPAAKLSSAHRDEAQAECRADADEAIEMMTAVMVFRST